MGKSAIKVLVIGASGFIGNILLKEFSRRHQVLGTFCNHPVDGLIRLDIKNKSAISNIVNSFAPTVILQPAANPDVEYCEGHREETWELNVRGTKNVAEVAEENNVKVVYFSSEYIFDGNNGPYAEEDAPHPISVYGEQKLASERLIQETLEDYLIVRTTVVYGWERQGKNSVMRMINESKNNQSIKVPSDQIGTPTYAINMAEAVRELVEKEKKGVYHIVGTDLMDRYSFAKIVARIFSLAPELIIPVSTSELGQKAPRPLKAGLRTDKARREIGTRLMGVEEGLSMMKDDLWRRGIRV